MILIDSNILIRYAQAANPSFPAVDAAINALHSAGEELCVVPQNIYEFWAVATRPVAENGLGLPDGEFQAQVVRIRRLFRFLPNPQDHLAEWAALVVTHACHGRESYDARLVAAMKTHGITRLLSFNGPAFARFPGVTLLDPARFVAAVTPPPRTVP